MAGNLFEDLYNGGKQRQQRFKFLRDIELILILIRIKLRSINPLYYVLIISLSGFIYFIYKIITQLSNPLN